MNVGGGASSVLLSGLSAWETHLVSIEAMGNDCAVFTVEEGFV